MKHATKTLTLISLIFCSTFLGAQTEKNYANYVVPAEIRHIVESTGITLNPDGTIFWSKRTTSLKVWSINQTRVGKLVEIIEKYQLSTESLASRINGLENELANLRSENGMLKTQNDSLVTSNSQLMAALQSAQDAIFELRVELGVAKAQRDEAIEELTQVRRELAALQNRPTTFRANVGIGFNRHNTWRLHHKAAYNSLAINTDFLVGDIHKRLNLLAYVQTASAISSKEAEKTNFLFPAQPATGNSFFQGSGGLLIHYGIATEKDSYLSIATGVGANALWTRGSEYNSDNYGLELAVHGILGNENMEAQLMCSMLLFGDSFRADEPRDAYSGFFVKINILASAFGGKKNLGGFFRISSNSTRILTNKISAADGFNEGLGSYQLGMNLRINRK